MKKKIVFSVFRPFYYYTLSYLYFVFRHLYISNVSPTRYVWVNEMCGGGNIRKNTFTCDARYMYNMTARGGEKYLLFPEIVFIVSRNIVEYTRHRSRWGSLPRSTLSRSRCLYVGCVPLCSSPLVFAHNTHIYNTVFNSTEKWTFSVLIVSCGTRIAHIVNMHGWRMSGNIPKLESCMEFIRPHTSSVFILKQICMKYERQVDNTHTHTSKYLYI